MYCGESTTCGSPLAGVAVQARGSGRGGGGAAPRGGFPGLRRWFRNPAKALVGASGPDGDGSPGCGWGGNCVVGWLSEPRGRPAPSVGWSDTCNHLVAQVTFFTDVIGGARMADQPTPA